MRHGTAGGVMDIVERLSRVPDRSCGTPGGADAAGEIARLLRDMGLSVREEPFRFLHGVVASSALIEGGRALPHVPLAYGATGQVRAHGVDGGTGEDDLVSREDVRGAVVLVRRDAVRHRQAQYRACVAAGAAAMVLVSSAPGDAAQEGSVRDAWEGPGSIPCLAVGGETGAALLESAAGGRLRLELSVDLVFRRAEGRNLIARIDGSGDARGLQAGAHYDAWGPGAVDNASGIAALVACAEHLVREPPAAPVDIIAFDGEELGLLGAWHHVRHRGPGPGVLLNLEMPSCTESVIRALACTSGPSLSAAAESAGLSACYDVSGPMASVPELMGGTIPADVWPYYLAGLGAMVTVCDTPHYHTALDLPSTLAGDHLARVAEASAACLRELVTAPSASLQGKDVPRGALRAQRIDGELHLETSFEWEDGQRVAHAPVEFLVFRSDFELLARLPALADGNGVYRARLGALDRNGPIDLTAHLEASGESAEAHLRLLP